jgi:hypothetical protein
VPHERWPARAFGVDLSIGFDVPALRRARVERVEDPTRLELADLEYSPSGEARPLARMPDGLGGNLVTVREHPGVGILFDAGARGRFLIGRGACRVACAVPPGPPGGWQRILVGQVLPLVAALRGLHVIHASAVSVDGGAIALAGVSGAGKSTLAAELAARGHVVVAEDVLALRLTGEGVVAEPGVSLVRLDGGQVDLPRVPEPLALRALYLLEAAEEGRPAVEPLPAPSPRDLMATAFVPYLWRGPRHLELAAALAGSVAVARARVDRAALPGDLADAIARHAASTAPLTALDPA